MMSKLHTSAGRATLLLGVSFGALLGASPALAQEAPVTSETPAPTVDAQDQTQPAPEIAQQPAEAAPASEDAIVVVGSRIRRNEFRP